MVLWPEEEDLYTLMCMRAESGRTAFEREKQNSPINPELCEWPETYFDEAIWFDDWPERLAGQDAGPGPEQGERLAAGRLLGPGDAGRRSAGASFTWRPTWPGGPTPQIVADGVELYRRFRPDVFGIEANQFQDLLGGEFEAEFRRQGVLGARPWPLENRINKLVRIRRLGPYLSTPAVAIQERQSGHAAAGRAAPAVSRRRPRRRSRRRWRWPFAWRPSCWPGRRPATAWATGCRWDDERINDNRRQESPPSSHKDLNHETTIHDGNRRHRYRGTSIRARGPARATTVRSLRRTLGQLRRSATTPFTTATARAGLPRRRRDAGRDAGVVFDQSRSLPKSAASAGSWPPATSSPSTAMRTASATSSAAATPIARWPRQGRQAGDPIRPTCRPCWTISSA